MLQVGWWLERCVVLEPCTLADMPWTCEGTTLLLSFRKLLTCWPPFPLLQCTQRMPRGVVLQHCLLARQLAAGRAPRDVPAAAGGAPAGEGGATVPIRVVAEGGGPQHFSGPLKVFVMPPTQLHYRLLHRSVCICPAPLEICLNPLHCFLACPTGA